MTVSWDEKLKKLQDSLKLSADGLASALGITTRTLSDFMKPVSEGGREPTGPVQRLVDLLSGELDSQSVGKKPQLNLVVIHGDFRVPPEKDAVSMIIDMHAAAGSQINNEFHYVTVEPERDKKWALEGLMKRRIQPHFFVSDHGLNNQEARDCYFTATTVWLSAQAMRRDLAHITLAADPVKFWPLAKELRELAEVDVTFVRETSLKQDSEIFRLLESIGINIVDPSGRKFGTISSLKFSAEGKVSFGFIEPEEPEQTGPSLFFSWNHMRKDKSGNPEMEIDQLIVGDRVSFGVGMNNKGACATEVVLVKRAENGEKIISPLSTPVQPRSNRAEEADLIDVLRDAVIVCADKDGWALLSDVGTRVNVQSDFRARLSAIKPAGTKIGDFCGAHPDIFEYHPHGIGSKEASARVRLKLKRS